MKRVIVIVLTVSALLGIIYINRDIAIESYTATSNIIKEEQKVAVISDFLSGNNEDLIVGSLKHIELSAILIVGDFIKSDTDFNDVNFNFVDDLVAIAPVLYVTGDQEWDNPDFHKIVEEMVKRGVDFIDNKAYVIDNVAYVGIEDPHGPNLPTVYQDIVRGVNADYFCLLAHQPHFFEIYKTWDVDLVLSGNTQGGYIELPFLGGIYAKEQGMFPKFTHGEYEENGSKLIVSRGTGSDFLPFRLFNRSEITIITIKRGW